MIYSYSSYDEYSILDLLNKSDKLTFGAKVSLYSELNNRKISKNDENVKQLKYLIDLEEDKIKNLEYLKDFGFELSVDNTENFEIIRPKRTTNMDITIAFIGLIFSLSSILGVVYYYVNFKDFNIAIKIGLLLFCILILRFGLITLFNAIDRLSRYSNFSFKVFDSKVIINKLVNNKMVQIQKDISSLQIKENEEELSLLVDDIKFLSIKEPNLINKKTMYAIYEKTLAMG